MMQLVAPEKEPITPFVRLVRSMYDDHGISSVLVIGGTGDYFDVADNVIVMDCYKCNDATERAKQIVANSQNSKIVHNASSSVPFGTIRSRFPMRAAYPANGKVKVASRSTISYGETELDISGVEQIVAKSQTSAIANALQLFPSLISEGKSTLLHVLKSVDYILDQGGLDGLAQGQFHGAMSRPRIFEIAAAVNRLRREKAVVQYP